MIDVSRSPTFHVTSSNTAVSPACLQRACNITVGRYTRCNQLPVHYLKFMRKSLPPPIFFQPTEALVSELSVVFMYIHKRAVAKFRASTKHRTEWEHKCSILRNIDCASVGLAKRHQVHVLVSKQHVLAAIVD